MGHVSTTTFAFCWSYNTQVTHSEDALNIPHAYCSYPSQLRMNASFTLSLLPSQSTPEASPFFSQPKALSFFSARLPLMPEEEPSIPVQYITTSMKTNPPNSTRFR